MLPYILNLADLFVTLYALNMGVQELNPIMRCVPVMIVYKVIVVGVLCLWLSRRPEGAAKWGLRLCTVVYGVLALYHCVGISMIK